MTAFSGNPKPNWSGAMPTTEDIDHAEGIMTPEIEAQLAAVRAKNAPTAIPDDVMKAAQLAFNRIDPEGSSNFVDPVSPIARAIMAERERCAHLIENTVTTADDWRAVYALLIRKGEA